MPVDLVWQKHAKPHTDVIRMVSARLLLWALPVVQDLRLGEFGISPFFPFFVHYFLENVTREPPITPKRKIRLRFAQFPRAE